MHDSWLDYLPHISIGIYPMPWSWYWYRKPWVSLYEGCFGFAWLFLDFQVNWLSRRFWGRRSTMTEQ